MPKIFRYYKGTRSGGLKAAAKNLSRDPNFYKRIGQKVGLNGHTGGFAASIERAKEAGRKGGSISSRAKHKLPLTARRAIYNLNKMLGI